LKRLLGSTSFSKRGTWIAIKGASGSGQDYVVKLIGALDRPSSGSIVVDGIDVAESTAETRLNIVSKRGLCFPIILSDSEPDSAGKHHAADGTFRSN